MSTSCQYIAHSPARPQWLSEEDTIWVERSPEVLLGDTNQELGEFGVLWAWWWPVVCGVYSLGRSWGRRLLYSPPVCRDWCLLPLARWTPPASGNSSPRSPTSTDTTRRRCTLCHRYYRGWLTVSPTGYSPSLLTFTVLRSGLSQRWVLLSSIIRYHPASIILAVLCLSF